MNLRFKSQFPRRDIVIELAEKGKELEAILLAWSIVEMNLDSAIYSESVLATREPQGLDFEKLTEGRIGDKIREQRRLGYLSEEEAQKLWAFKDKRDNLFHKGGLASDGAQIPQ